MYFHGRRFLPDFFFEQLFSHTPGFGAGSMWNGTGGHPGGSGSTRKRFFDRFGYKNGRFKAKNGVWTRILGKITDFWKQKPRVLNWSDHRFNVRVWKPQGGTLRGRKVHFWYPLSITRIWPHFRPKSRILGFSTLAGFEGPRGSWWNLAAHTPQAHLTAPNRFGMDAVGVLDDVGTLVDPFWSILQDSACLCLTGAGHRMIQVKWPFWWFRPNMWLLPQ